MKPNVYLIAFFAFAASVMLMIVLLIRSEGHSQHCETTAFRIVAAGSSSFEDLLMLYEAFPSTDAGASLAVSAGICIGLAGHYQAFAQTKPDDLEEAIEIALKADDAAFPAIESAAIKAAKTRLRGLRGR